MIPLCRARRPTYCWSDGIVGSGNCSKFTVLGSQFFNPELGTVNRFYYPSFHIFYHSICPMKTQPSFRTAKVLLSFLIGSCMISLNFFVFFCNYSGSGFTVVRFTVGFFVRRYTFRVNSRARRHASISSNRSIFIAL